MPADRKKELWCLTSRLDQAQKKQATEEPHLQPMPESLWTTGILRVTQGGSLSTAPQQVAKMRYLIHLQINRVGEGLHSQHSLTSFTQFP